MLFELPDFEHISVKSVREATFWLHDYGDKARVIAGATDLLSLMKERIEGPQLRIPEVLVNIKTIPEMNQISYDEKAGLRIGAAVTLNHIETSAVIMQKFTILSQAARQVGTTQIRNMGTIGGNICQRPRCMYFRHPHFLCFKKGGTKCYAITGEHRYYHSILGKGKCVMAHPSDIAPALIALNARAVITSSAGEKEVPLQGIFSGPNNVTELALQSNELLTEVRVPNQSCGTYQVFLKRRKRHSADFALSSVAAVAHVLDGICEDISIMLGGVAPFPYRASMAEDVVRGKCLDGRLAFEAGEASVEGAHPLPMNQYKVDLTNALVRCALTSIWRGATTG